MGQSLFRIINRKVLPSGSMQFTVALRTSLGLVYMKGWRLTTTGRLLAPRVGLYGPSIIVVPKNLKNAIRNRLEETISHETNNHTL